MARKKTKKKKSSKAASRSDKGSSPKRAEGNGRPREYQVDPYSALILVESPTKRPSVRKAVGIGIKKGAIDIPDDYRVEATVGHFRSLFDLTPYSEPPGAEVWPRYVRELVKEKDIKGDPTPETCKRVGDLNDFVAQQLVDFFRAHPATPEVVESNPDPEINPGRYLGIDVESNGAPIFWPHYWVPSVDVYRRLESLLRALTRKPRRLYLATDRDREGEGIAWHVLEAFRNFLQGVDVRRMRFTSTAPGDIIEAIQEADAAADRGEAAIDKRLVSAYVAREVLDRLIGYPGSRALWRLNEGRDHRMRAIKMGRVKFAALGLLLRQEEEAMQSLPDIRYRVNGEGSTQRNKFPVSAVSDAPFEDEAALTKELSATSGTVRKSAGPTVSKKRMPGYHLARLQTDMEREFRVRPSRSMALAQEMFEGALITYHRTDSDKPSGAGFGLMKDVALKMRLIEHEDEATFPFFTTSANAQEGHEALRPVPSAVLDRFVEWWLTERKKDSDRFHALRDVEHGKRKLGSDELKLFEMVARRSLASILEGPEVETRSVIIDHPALKPYETAFTAESKQIGDRGYLVIWSGFDRLSVPSATKHTLPTVAPGDAVKIRTDGKKFETTVSHPRRASLTGFAGKLADEGIGRPATNTRMLQDLEDAGYVQRIELEPVTASGAPVSKDEEGYEEDPKKGKRKRGLKSGAPGMSRYGAFIANLARHVFSRTLSIGTTKAMEESLDRLLDVDPERLMQARVGLLSEHYSRFVDQLAYARHLCSRYGGYAPLEGRLLAGFASAADGCIPGVHTIESYLENANDRLNVVHGVTAEADELVEEAVQRAFPNGEWDPWGSMMHYGRALTKEGQTGAWIGVWRPRIEDRPKKGESRKAARKDTAVVRSLFFYLDPESEPPGRVLSLSSNIDLEAPIPCRPLVSQFVHLNRLKEHGINFGDRTVPIDGLKFIDGETNVAVGSWAPKGRDRRSVGVLLGHFGQRIERSLVNRFRGDARDYDDLIIAAAAFGEDAAKPTVDGPPVYLVPFSGAEQGNDLRFHLPVQLDDSEPVLVEDPALGIAHRIREHVEVITLFRMRNRFRMPAPEAWDFLIEQWQLAVRRYGPKYGPTIYDRNATMADMIRYDGRNSVASFLLAVE